MGKSRKTYNLGPVVMQEYYTDSSQLKSSVSLLENESKVLLTYYCTDGLIGSQSSLEFRGKKGVSFEVMFFGPALNDATPHYHRKHYVGSMHKGKLVLNEEGIGANIPEGLISCFEDFCIRFTKQTKNKHRTSKSQKKRKVLAHRHTRRSTKRNLQQSLVA